MRFGELDIGWQSHLLATAVGGEHVERPDGIVVRMPGNAAFYWGNCLILPQAPHDDELAHWLGRFSQEHPAAGHVAIGVNAPFAGEALPSWTAAGFERDETAVLVLERGELADAQPPRVEGEWRALRLPEEAALAIDLQCLCNDAGFEPAGYRRFRESAMQTASAYAAQERGGWYGLFVSGLLSADCGLVHDGRIGRFQHVETHPQQRRLGLCRALVHGVCRQAFDVLGLQRLVMCADPHDVAIAIYQSLGFRVAARHWHLQRRTEQDRTT